MAENCFVYKDVLVLSNIKYYPERSAGLQITEHVDAMIVNAHFVELLRKFGNILFLLGHNCVSAQEDKASPGDQD
ncbi:hypothetical protein K0M31_010602, partial [Melipona bicolor]